MIFQELFFSAEGDEGILHIRNFLKYRFKKEDKKWEEK